MRNGSCRPQSCFFPQDYVAVSRSKAPARYDMQAGPRGRFMRLAALCRSDSVSLSWVNQTIQCVASHVCISYGTVIQYRYTPYQSQYSIIHAERHATL